MLRSSVLFPVGLSIGLLAAQHSPLGGPVEAFAFDPPAKSFRAISGTLGAALLGPALAGEFDLGSVAPRQNYAIAFKRGQGVVVAGIGSDQQSFTVLSDSFSTPEGIIWSGDGTAAIVYSRTGNWLQAITGLPGAVTVSPSVSVASLGGSLSSVSTDLHGEHIFVCVTGDSAGVYQVMSDQILVSVLPLSKPIAAAVSDDNQTLYALDGAGNLLYELSLIDSSSQAWPLNGIDDPVAVTVTRDAMQRKVVYIAGRADRILRAYDAVTHEVIVSLPLDFQPLIIEPLGQHSFLLGYRVNAGDPLWSFTDAAEPMVYFVPVTPPVASGEQSK